MRVKRDLETQQYTWPVKHGGTTINDGALLMAGTTAETNLGVLIIASSAGADCMGILVGQLASTVTDLLVAGTVWNQKLVHPVTPMRVIECDYDTTDTMAVASTSTTTVTITSLEDNIDTSYLYAVSGTGIGSLYFVDTSTSGSCTTKTATGWDSTTTAIKVLRLFHQLAKLNTTADKIGTDAGAGSYTLLILQNWIQYGGQKVPLDPTKHSGLTGLNSYGDIKFLADIGCRNAGPYTID
jgi:hypothetical protein